jgi:hypothetical protein
MLAVKQERDAAMVRRSSCRAARLGAAVVAVTLLAVGQSSVSARAAIVGPYVSFGADCQTMPVYPKSCTASADWVAVGEQLQDVVIEVNWLKQGVGWEFSNCDFNVLTRASSCLNPGWNLTTEAGSWTATAVSTQTDCSAILFTASVTARMDFTDGTYVWLGPSSSGVTCPFA